tara:strand:+ start:9620 stop:9817 length:198 start_codon:yes stop_codon:yes gene_type:complete
MTELPRHTPGGSGHYSLTETNWHEVNKKMTDKIRRMIAIGRMAPNTPAEVEIRREYLRNQKKGRK